MDGLRRRWPAAAVGPSGEVASAAVPLAPVSPITGAPGACIAGDASSLTAAAAAGGASATRRRRPRSSRPWTATAAEAASLAGAPLVIAFFTAMTAGSALLIDGAGGLALGLARLAGAPRWAVARAQSAVLRAWMSIYVGHLELFGRMTLVVRGDPFVRGESALVVCNHRSWTDTIVLYSLARQVGAHGDVKFFTKRSLLWFPVYGVAGVLCNVCLFIQRDMSAAAGAFASLRAQLTGADAKPSDAAASVAVSSGSSGARRFPPFWLINYLEGTRLTPAKVAASQKFAASRNLPILSHVLLPRTKGFIASASALRGAATAVYDVTIGYAPDALSAPSGSPSPSFTSMLLTAGMGPRVLFVHQRRIPMEEVPSDPAALSDWLYELYAAKDARLARLAATGSFEGEPVSWTRFTWAHVLGCIALFWASVGAVLWVGLAALRLWRGSA